MAIFDFSDYNTDDDDKLSPSQKASKSIEKQKKAEKQIFDFSDYKPKEAAPVQQQQAPAEKPKNFFQKAKDAVVSVFKKKSTDEVPETPQLKQLKEENLFEYTQLTSVPALLTRIKEIDENLASGSPQQQPIVPDIIPGIKEEKVTRGIVAWATGNKTQADKLIKERQYLKELIDGNVSTLGYQKKQVDEGKMSPEEYNKILAVQRVEALKSLKATKKTTQVSVGAAQTAASTIDFGQLIGDQIGSERLTKSSNDQSEGLRSWAKLYESKDPDFTDKLLQGFGSTLPFVLLGGAVSMGAKGVAAVSPTVATWFAAGASGALEAGTEAGSLYVELKKEGISSKEAKIKADALFIANLGWNTVLNRFGLNSEEAAGLKKIFYSASMEGVQEMGQQFMSNLAGNRPLDEGVIESGVIGSVVGGGFATLSGGSGAPADPITTPDVAEKIIGLEPSANVQSEQKEEIKLGTTELSSDLVESGLPQDFQEKINRQTPKIKELEAAITRGDALPPIPVYEENGKYYTNKDGDNRLIAYKNLEIKSIPVEIQEKTTLTGTQKQTEERAKAEKVAASEKLEVEVSKKISEYYSKAEDQEAIGQAWYEVMSEMEIAEAGRRIYDEDGNVTGGQSSTFPSFVPSHLRIKSLFDSVMDGFADPANLVYPPDSQPRKQELFEEILNQIDARAGTDGGSVIVQTKENYGKTSNAQDRSSTKEKPKAAPGRSTTRSEGSKTEIDKKEVKDSDIEKYVAKRGTIKFREFKQSIVEMVDTKKFITTSADFQNAQEDVVTGTFAVSKLPVLAKKNENGTYEVIDGNHRLAKALIAGEKTVEVITDEVAYGKLVDLEQGDLKQLRDARGRFAGVDRRVENYVDNRGAVKFREPSTKKELVTIHNLNATGVIKANKMGGLPVPSIAITKADIGLEGFGEISLVGGSEFANEDIYMADVYSKRVPRESFEINTEMAYPLANEARQYGAEVMGQDFDRFSNALADRNNLTLKSLKQAAVGSEVAKAMYLDQELDIKLEPVYKENRPSTDTTTTQALIANNETEVLNLGSQDFNEKTDPYKTAKQIIEKIVDEEVATLDSKGLSKELQKKLAAAYREKYFTEDGDLAFGPVARLYIELRESQKSPKIVDKSAMVEKLMKHNDKLTTSALESWVDKKYGGIFGRSFFYNDKGTKKQYTLDNIMNYMLGRVRGKETFFYGSGSLKALISKKISGLDQLRAKQDLLQSEETNKNIHDQISEDLTDLLDTISNGPGVTYEYQGIAQELGTVGASFSKAKVKNILQNRIGYKNAPDSLVTEVYDFLNRLKNAPVSYFELKPQRVVDLSEFKGAIVPNDVEPKVIKILEDKGLYVVKYDSQKDDKKSKIEDIEKYLNKRSDELKFREDDFKKNSVKDDVKQFTGKDITDAQESEIIALNKKIFGDDNVKITLQIMANNQALGSSRDGMIEILSGQVAPKDTFYHEAVHKYLDVFSTRDEQIELFKAGIEKYETTNLSQVEELIAEDFIAYAKSREGVVGRLKLLFDRFLGRIQAYLGNRAEIEALYQKILSPKPGPTKITKEELNRTPEQLARTLEPETKDIPDKDGFSRFQERLEEQLLDTNGQKYNWDDTTRTYDKISLESDAKKATTLVTDNPEKALMIAKGFQDPNAGDPVLFDVINAVALQAFEEGNVSLGTQMVNKVSLTATRYGQNIATLRGNFNNNSPQNYIKQVIDARLEKLGSSSLAEVEKLIGKKNSAKTKAIAKVDLEVEKLKKRVQKKMNLKINKIKLAQDIIDSITCV